MKFVRGILSEDIIALTKAPGIGKKTAQRIILELKDKMDTFILTSDIDDASPMCLRGKID